MTSFIRAFFAIEINTLLRDQINSIVNELKKMNTYQCINWIPSEKLHITLRFFQHLNIADIPYLIREIENHLSLLQSFDLVFDVLCPFPSERKPRYIVLEMRNEVPAFTSLINTLTSVNEKLGYPEDNKLFRCHMTLGKIQKNEEFSGKESIISTLDPIHVKEIVLLHSVIQNNKSIYIPMVRIPIGKLKSE